MIANLRAKFHPFFF